MENKKRYLIPEIEITIPLQDYPLLGASGGDSSIPEEPIDSEEPSASLWDGPIG